MRLADVLLSFPLFVVVVAAVAITGPGIANLVWVVGLLGWPRIARIVRAQVLSLRTQPYVEATHALGAGDLRVLGGHVLPNVLPTVVIAATFGVARAVLLEASLSFLGMGVQAPQPSWGNILTAAQSLSVLESMPWMWVPAGACLMAVVLAVNFIGDGLRDALDPRARTPPKEPDDPIRPPRPCPRAAPRPPRGRPLLPHPARPAPRRTWLAGGVSAGFATMALTDDDLTSTVRRIGAWYRAAREHPEVLPATSVADLRAAHASGRLGVVLAFQNSSPFGDDLDSVELFHRLGVRAAILAYNQAELAGDGCMEPRDAGLSAFGRRLVAEMNRVGMLVDLSHCGVRTTLEAIDASSAPVAITHTGAKSVYDHPRTVSDEQLRAVAARDGFVGINAHPAFLRAGTAAPPLDAVVDHLFARGRRRRHRARGLGARLLAAAGGAGHQRRALRDAPAAGRLDRRHAAGAAVDLPDPERGRGADPDRAAAGARGVGGRGGRGAGGERVGVPGAGLGRLSAATRPESQPPAGRTGPDRSTSTGATCGALAPLRSQTLEPHRILVVNNAGTPRRRATSRIRLRAAWKRSTCPRTSARRAASPWASNAPIARTRRTCGSWTTTWCAPRMCSSGSSWPPGATRWPSPTPWTGVAARILLLEDGKLQKARMVLRGIRDARAGRIGKLD